MNVVPALAVAWHRLKAGVFLWRASRRKMESEPMLCAELFSAEQMERYGVALAMRHRLSDARHADRLLGRLDDNEKVLSDCYRMFAAVTALALKDRRITPAGEWLLDNYYLVEEQIRTARRHLPRRYSRELPQLAAESYDAADASRLVENRPEGLPRAYDLALENISHSDGRLDSRVLARFVAAYQTVTPLTLGELWAIPIMVRLALLENLRRVAIRVTAAWRDHALAVEWADRMLETAERDRKSVVLAVADMAAANPPMTSSFVAEFARRLQGQSTALALPLAWVEERLAEAGRSLEDMVQTESQQQAADQVSISNTMASLRGLSAVDWREFVESLSLVEKTLREDPAGVYPLMDFASRDQYRHMVEKLARSFRWPEQDVAAAAVDLARRAASAMDLPAAVPPSGPAGNLPAPVGAVPDMPEPGPAETHVGYYLVGAGRPVLTRAIRSLRPGADAVPAPGRRRTRHTPLALYLGSALALTLLFAWPFFTALSRAAWWHSAWGIPAVLAGIVVLFAAGRTGLQAVNWLVTLVVPPDFLPRLDFSRGIPPSARTMVVVPTLIGKPEHVDKLLEELEIHYLANRDDNIRFGLLTDFMDAPEERTSKDKALLDYARISLKALNARYPGPDGDRFFLCHRPRLWNEEEGVWMGYERKRGKLAEFNALLRGRGHDRFLLLAGDAVADPAGPEKFSARYVITLDADTRLPRDAARQMAGAMAHPLNRPVYDAGKKRVTAGYGILQPLVGVGLTSAESSSYARLFCCEAGIDPYTRNVSDVYQDLFGEGSFIGKGIYDVDAFELATGDRFPDNSILSHDLIESGFARSGLLSDVQLYEGYPARYSADVSRRYRWVRGDWQLLPWVLPRPPVRGGGRENNPLSALYRWKLLDNLRRSLTPAALIILLALGWFSFSRPLAWTLGVLLLLFALPLLGFVQSLTRRPEGISPARHLRAGLHALHMQLLRELLTLAWLPHEAWYCLDAMLRTLWRQFVSHRHLLQWNPSHEAERTAPRTLPGLYRMMWMCPALAAGLAVLLTRRPVALGTAGPFLLLWALAPALAWMLSRPATRESFVPDQEQKRFLHCLARRTWAFFEHYVNAENNWLPPDNMQESPVRAVAHRTSPTNMGLALLAHLAARDFGYLSPGRMLKRLERTLNAMDGLERYEGHLYNWYDTRTLQPLPPLYVSTVDNGNLAGHLLTLRSGLLELADAPAFDCRVLAGLGDTADVLADALKAEGIDCPAWQSFLRGVEETRDMRFFSLDEAADQLQRLLTLAEGLQASCLPAPESDAAFWEAALIEQCRDIHRDLQAYLLPTAVTVTDRRLGMPTWRDMASLDVRMLPESARARASEVRDRAAGRIALAERLARRAAELADMDFSLLYDPRRGLLSIGYNVNERRRDLSYYDLLASEARLTYFVAVASGQLPQDSWFSLGRLLTGVDGAPVLLSWSGSMFEYLMPPLVMPSYEGSLLDSTCRGAVARQIEYGRLNGLPWGISESCYNTLDSGLNYQYRAFGVPGLGFKPGLGEDMVLAPYATVMALMFAPQAACRNLKHLAEQGLAGRFGLYEAVDYTPSRLPRGKRSAVIPAFMSHHQGMSLLALLAVLREQPMQRRFLADPRLQAAELLLQERKPQAAPEFLHDFDASPVNLADATARSGENRLRVVTDPQRTPPAVQLLSNGQYHVMISSGGGGYSRWKDLAVTRWREDVTRDNWGTFCYLRDTESGEFWSAAFQPTCGSPDRFEAIFSDARAEFRVRHRDFDAHTEIVVSPEDDVELRRVRLTNRSRLRRTLELTSYAEVVMAPPAADAQHPAFSKLFVQTEILRPLQAIACTRRPRGDDEPEVWLCHLLALHGGNIASISYETDRSRFLGRDRTPADPAAMDTDALSDTAGAVLDPIVSIRVRIALAPGQTVVADLITGMSRSREECLRQIHKFRDRRLADRVFDLAWTHSQVLLHQFNASLADARLYQELAASILYANPFLRAKPSVLNANMRNQSGLWGQSISGDLPIVLLKINDSANIDMASQMVKAHAYWRMKGLAVDLVIWNEERASYRQQLQDMIVGLLPAGVEVHLAERPGGIFVRPEQQLSREERILIQAVARVILSDTRGSLAEQVRRRRAAPALPRSGPGWKRPGYRARPLPVEYEGRRDQPDPEGLILSNPHGGFTPDGEEYVIALHEGEALPAPWVNVLANSGFGSVVSASGSAYTWKENAHEFRLTPWANDPVSDGGGEVLYLRDEENGRYWSPTPMPRNGGGTYLIRHGFGYTAFEHRHDGLHTELTVFVDREAPVKFLLLRVRNESGRSRRLSATGYVEWVLGDRRERTAMHVVTESDPVTGTLFARNAYTMDFPGRVAFFDADGRDHTFTGDRAEFIGRNRDLSTPAAMGRAHLSGRTGPGLDPCGAIQTAFNLGNGESRETVFLLGAGSTVEEAAALVQRFRDAGAAHAALDEVRAFWRRVLGTVRVSTPDPAVNVLADGWLLYQTTVCRFWARSGFYQSGGAFGFRDQLQDSMAMIYALPQASRLHLLRCAGHQFPEGDVQHWWHPPLSRGVRTHCSDDYLWLPLAVSRYVDITGDAAVLDEVVPYIEGPSPAPDVESLYDLPITSSLAEPLYRHCVRAIEHGLRKGRHGLPLIGTGDWNDGMNKVGEHGKGESVWLGFFLYTVLERFADTARLHGDQVFAERCGREAAALRESLDVHGWDGEWYRRAYFDDGTPLGSADNEECRIDSIAQSWSVLSGAAPDWRQRAAMASLEARLVRRDIGIIQLLDPPFDRSSLEPGYIKGYLPGVRENGGQYTHAALWAVMAFAALGDAERAWELLRLINPVRHGDSAAAVAAYKVEPYVASADVYAVPPHEGRGGWSWYTGAAGWMYRLIVESLLGLRVRGNSLTLAPLLPADWPGFSLEYRYRSSLYRIEVSRADRPDAAPGLSLDGGPLPGGALPLVDDGREHRVELRLA